MSKSKLCIIKYRGFNSNGSVIEYGWVQKVHLESYKQKTSDFIGLTRPGLSIAVPSNLIEVVRIFNEVEQVIGGVKGEIQVAEIQVIYK